MNEFSEIENASIESLEHFLDSEALLCTKLGCCNKLHLKQLDDMYSTLINSHSRGKKKFSKTVIKRNKFKVIPGWNCRVKYYHNHARSKYLVWLNMGKIRNGIEFDEMRDSRTAFKNALNACKVNENVERSLSIKEKFENKSMSSFWKDVQHTNNKIKRSNVIDGKNENKDIIGIFTEFFFECWHR